MIAAAIMLVVLTVMGLVSWPTGLYILPIAAMGGLLFAGLGLVTTSMVKTISQFNVPIFVIIMPMFTFGGTFFPIDVLPSWALAIAWCLPLTHISLLARAAILGWWHPMVPVSAAYITIAAVLLATLALVRMKRRLVQ